MGLFKRTKQGATFGFYGKHPSAADFLRHNATSKELQLLDQYISNALDPARRALGEHWDAWYPYAPIVNFVVGGPTSPKGRCVVGCFAPSTDESGRQYPLILFCELPCDEVVTSIASIPLLPTLRRMRETLNERESASRNSVVQHLERYPVPSSEQWSALRDDVTRFLETTPAINIFSSMYGADQSAVYTAVNQWNRFARGLPGSKPRYGVRCPLGSTHDYGVCVWLESLARATPNALPNVFWTAQRLVVYAGDVSRKVLAAIWGPDEYTDESLWDIGSEIDPNAPAFDWSQPVGKVF